MSELAALTIRAEEALAAARANPSAETRAAASAASAALSAAIADAGLQPKQRGYSTRAGKRQQAEMRAAGRSR